MKSLTPVLKVLWANRKAEIAIILGVISIVREVVQATTGH